MSLTPTQLGLVSHFSALALLFSALLIPPSKLTRTQLALTFLPPIWACHIYSWSVGLGFLAAVQVLWATELLLFQSPREKLKVVCRTTGASSTTPKLQAHQSPVGSSSDQESEKEKKVRVRKQPYPTNFWERRSWVFKLHISMRYVGWETGVPVAAKKTFDAPSQKGAQTRTSWLLRNTFLAMFCFLIIDATNAYQRLDPYFQVETSIDEPFPARLAGSPSRYGLDFLPSRMVRIVVLATQQYVTFALINRVLAIIHVSLGGLGILDEWWGGVENWPMLMGSPLVVLDSGLRGFWGRGWHQMFRSLFTSPGNAIISVLGVKPKSTTAYAVKLAVAFFLSGVLHAATLPFDIVGLSPLRYAAFFWIHGICVLIEVFVERALGGNGRLKFRSKGPKFALAGMRAVWTVGVLFLTAPLIVNELTRVTRTMGVRPTMIFKYKLL